MTEWITYKTDTSINPGNSGGALNQPKGELLHKVGVYHELQRATIRRHETFLPLP